MHTVTLIHSFTSIEIIFLELYSGDEEPGEGLGRLQLDREPAPQRRRQGECCCCLRRIDLFWILECPSWLFLLNCQHFKSLLIQKHFFHYCLYIFNIFREGQERKYWKDCWRKIRFKNWEKNCAKWGILQIRTSLLPTDQNNILTPKNLCQLFELDYLNLFNMISKKFKHNHFYRKLF